MSDFKRFRIKDLSFIIFRPQFIVLGEEKHHLCSVFLNKFYQISTLLLQLVCGYFSHRGTVGFASPGGYIPVLSGRFLLLLECNFDFLDSCQSFVFMNPVDAERVLKAEQK